MKIKLEKLKIKQTYTVDIALRNSIFSTRVWKILISKPLIPYFPRVQWDSGHSLFTSPDQYFRFFHFWLFSIFLFWTSYMFMFYFLFTQNLCANCLFFGLELGPGSVIIGFSAKNNTGYANSRPNWRQESLFYDHSMFFPRSPSRHWAFLKIIRNFLKEFWGFRLSFLIARFPYHKVKGVYIYMVFFYTLLTLW